MKESPSINPFRHYVYPGGGEALSYLPLPNDPSPPFFGWLEHESENSKTFHGGDVRIVVSLMNVGDLVWMKVIQGDPQNPTFTSEGPFLPPLPYYSVDATTATKTKRVRRGRSKSKKGHADSMASPKEIDDDCRNNSRKKSKNTNRNVKNKKGGSSKSFSDISLAQLCAEFAELNRSTPKASLRNVRRKRGPGGLVTTAESNGFVLKASQHQLVN